MQSNIENPKHLPNAEVALDKFENTCLLSVNEERCTDIISDAPKENLVEVCKNLNNIFTEQFKNNNLNFLSALNSKVKNLVW